jgi:hypothetical protein
MFYGFEGVFCSKFVVVRYTPGRSQQPHPNLQNLNQHHIKNLDSDQINNV